VQIAWNDFSNKTQGFHINKNQFSRIVDPNKEPDVFSKPGAYDHALVVPGKNHRSSIWEMV